MLIFMHGSASLQKGAAPAGRTGRQTPMNMPESYRQIEVKSYDVPFSQLSRPVFWFNDSLRAGTWSNRHIHDDWGELAFVRAGYMVVCAEPGNYLAPPHRAVWIPPGLSHEWYLPEDSIDCSLYVRPDVLREYPRFLSYHALEISPLVRELIVFLSVQDWPYPEGVVSRAVAVLFDQLVLAPETDMPLAMPHDRRLIGLCTALLKEPHICRTVPQWCDLLGMSERTLARLFKEQTGETFGRWRQKIRLQHAAVELRTGASVTSVALGCGYASVSAFISAFKDFFGCTPGRML